MQLENYISDLLYRYECVIVPGLGAFLSHRIPARINSDGNSFFPPQKRISFNTQVDANDGLLAKYISNCENITYEEAVKQIEVAVRSLKIELQDKKRVNLDKIGAFSLNQEDAILFEPQKEINYLTDAFGLSSVAVKPIAVEENIQVSEEKVVQLHDHRASKNRVWMKYAAAGILAIGLTSSMGYMYLKDVQDHNVAAKQEAVSKLENQIQEATFTINSPLPTITLNAFKPMGKYHIVAGAFRKEENAQTRVEQLREDGYKARQIGENKFGLHQVVYGSYADANEALIALRQVRQNDNQGAWLLVEELENNK